MLLKVGDIEVGMSRWGAVLGLIGLGFYVGGSIILGVVAGLWLDNRLNTEPILMIGGLILGLAIAFLGIYRMLLPLIRNKRDKENS